MNWVCFSLENSSYISLNYLSSDLSWVFTDFFFFNYLWLAWLTQLPTFYFYPGRIGSWERRSINEKDKERCSISQEPSEQSPPWEAWADAIAQPSGSPSLGATGELASEENVLYTFHSPARLLRSLSWNEFWCSKMPTPFVLWQARLRNTLRVLNSTWAKPES